MKFAKLRAVVIITVAVLSIISCASVQRPVELETKGSAMGIPTPNWVTTYIAHGISGVQARPEFRDRYCVIGTSIGVNLEFVLAWADHFSAQQIMGAMLRTNIATRLNANADGVAQSLGLFGDSTGEYLRQIDNSINTVLNISFSGTQREADWWTLTRRYDPDQRGVYTDEYRAYVLYTIPKSQLDQQIAYALATSIDADHVLYDITIQIARDILSGSMSYLGSDEPGPVASPTLTPEQRREINAIIQARF